MHRRSHHTRGAVRSRHTRDGAGAVRVLVTGARGMLGAAVARALAARGDAVRVLQRGPSGLPFPEVRADLCDPAGGAALDAAVDGCDAVLHLAAKVDVVGPWRDGTLARLAWRSDQPRALGARAFAALAAAGRRWVACGVRAVGLLRATLAGR